MSRLLSTRWSHVLDYENGLKQASLSGGITVTHSYDALGRRIQRSSSGSTIKFVYDGADVMRDLDATGATIADYINGPEIDNKLRQTVSGTGSYFFADHLATTRGLTDTNGNASSGLTHDSFGNLTSGSTTTPCTTSLRGRPQFQMINNKAACSLSRPAFVPSVQIREIVVRRDNSIRKNRVAGDGPIKFRSESSVLLCGVIDLFFGHYTAAYRKHSDAGAFRSENLPTCAVITM